MSELQCLMFVSAVFMSSFVPLDWGSVSAVIAARLPFYGFLCNSKLQCVMLPRERLLNSKDQAGFRDWHFKEPAVTAAPCRRGLLNSISPTTPPSIHPMDPSI